MNDILSDMLQSTILETIAQANVPHGAAELARMTGIPAEELAPMLESLLVEGKIAMSKKGKYALPERLGLLVGRVFFTHAGAPIFRCDDGEASLRITSAGRLRAMPEDRVLVRPSAEGSADLERILRRAKQSLTACVRIEQGRRSRRDFDQLRATATPCDPRIPYAIRLGGDISFLRNGEIALLEIDSYPEGERPILAHACRVLGKASSLLTRLRATAEEHGFPSDFPDEVEVCAAALQRESLPACGDDRRDLRSETIFTIDGASSKDFDDAVSIQAMPEGWRLGVHIADVSHYVRPDSPIDREAYARGTSLYLPGLTIPMLPEALSNDLCSLMPQVDRPAMSLIMDIDERGRVTDHLLTPSLIRSCARLSYDAVNRLFDGSDEAMPAEVKASLFQMRSLAALLRSRRRERGSIDFEMEEASFILNEDYEPTDILCPPRGEAERLIEDFMLLANETVARLARDTMLPFIYRIHEHPDPDRLHALEEFLHAAGTPVHLGDNPHPGMLQRILDGHAGEDMIEILRRHMLRALKRACYSEKPAGHYALSMQDYCHFTSPIRRYPDLVAHRMLKLLLAGSVDMQRWEKRMPELAKQSSAREQEAVRAEREAEAMLKAAWMRHNLGRKFYGVITSVTSWGAYVTLPNTVEGLVHVSDMDDYFNYDPQRQQLVGSMHGDVLQPGMRVRVRAIDASVSRGEINFELTELLGT